MARTKQTKQTKQTKTVNKEPSVVLFGASLEELAQVYREYLEHEMPLQEEDYWDAKDTFRDGVAAFVGDLVAGVARGEPDCGPELNYCYVLSLQQAKGHLMGRLTEKPVTLTGEPASPVKNKLDFSGQVGSEKSGIMTTIAQNKNIMDIFGLWLEEHGYVDAVAKIDEDAWRQLGEAVTAAMPKKSAKKGSDKIKDPNKPKKNKSAYLYFCAANRAAVKEELGDEAKATDVTKELGRKWVALKASKKATDQKELAGYDAEAAADKVRYEDEMKDYEPPSEEELEVLAAKKGKRGSKGKKDPNKPKKNKSAYLYFCAANRAAVKEELGDEAKATDVTARLGELWRDLKDDEDRADELEKYNKQAVEDKARYEEEMKNYTPPSDGEEEDKKPAPKAKKGAKKASGKKGAKKAVKKPAAEEDGEETEEELVEEEEVKKPAKKAAKKSRKKSTGKNGSKKKMNGYTYFCREYRQKVKEANPDMKATDVSKELAKMWKELTKDEQGEWNEAAQNAE